MVEDTFREAFDRVQEHAEIVLDNQIASRPDWLKMRRTGLGGSDAASAAGFNPFKSPYALWVDKTTEDFETEENEAMKWGRRLEEPIGHAWSEETGIPVRRFPYMLRSKMYPWATVNLDFLAPESVVECKSVGLRMADQWKDGAVPDQYSLQGQHAVLVTGMGAVDFPVLIGGQELRKVHVERNDALIADLVSIEDRFWKLVLDLTPPDIDGSESTKDALAAQYANPSGATVELPPTAAEYLAAIKAFAEQEKALKTEKTRYENEIKAMLGDHSIGTIDGQKVVTWKQVPGSTYTVNKEPYRRLLRSGEFK